MPEPETEAEAIALLIRNTLELYQQMEVTSYDIAMQDVAALNMVDTGMSGRFAAFRVGDRYYIGEPA